MSRRSLAGDLREKEISRVAQHHLQSKVGERKFAGGIEARHIESKISRNVALKFGTEAAGPVAVQAKALPGMPPGVGLREAVIMEMLLGPPACRRGHHPRSPWRLV